MKLGYARNLGIEEIMGGFLTRAMRNLCIALLFLTVGLCSLIVVVPPFLDRIYYEGPTTNHFDGARFFNPGTRQHHRPAAVVAISS
jgi:hypothetical protein